MSLYDAASWLPDWKDKSKYDSLYTIITTTTAITYHENQQIINRKTVKTPTSKAAFAWEFLRRNPVYQADYKHLCERATTQILYRSWSGFELPYLEDIPAHLEFHSKLYKTITKWGLSDLLPDPRHSLHDGLSLKWLLSVGIAPFKSSRFYVNSDGEQIPYDCGSIFNDNHCQAVFDITLPIEPQINNIKSMLENMQKTNLGKLVTAGNYPLDKLAIYLRILDADASGASDNEIRKVLYPHKPATISTPKANYSPRNNILQQNRKSALQLRDFAYRYLLNE